MKKIIVFIIISLITVPVYADEFLDSLKEQVELEPDNAYNYYAMGMYYGKMNDPAGAVRYLSTAYRMEPGSTSILYD